MPIPTYDNITLPLLKLVSDLQVHRLKDAIEILAQEFNLTEEEKESLLPSRRGKLFNNRVHWARFYLLRALLLEAPMRGCVKITQRGLKVLNQNPEKIDEKFLDQFKEFKDFKEKVRGVKTSEGITEEVAIIQTPTEALEEAYGRIRGELAQNLLDQIKSCSPNFFEQIVLDLILKMGYGGSRRDAGEKIGKSHDGGIDGIIKEDKLGLDAIYIQAKRWENIIGRPEIQKFVGALEGRRAKKGIFLTTSDFSNEAKNYILKINKKIVLIDGFQLAQYMIDYDIGVSTTDIYKIKKIDSDYFEEE